MGTSKSYHRGPDWTKGTHPGMGETPTASKGGRKSPEGSHESGSGDWGRKGMSNTARKKSKAFTGSARATVPTGQS